MDELAEATSDAALRRILDQLPHGLPATYDRILSRILTHSDADILKRGLKWVAAACRPLTLPEFQEAAVIQPSHIQWPGDEIPRGSNFLRMFHGLLINDRDKTIRFAHHSVLQHMTEPEMLLNGRYFSTSLVRFSIKDAQYLAANVCMSYLQFTDLQRALTIPDKNDRKVTINTVFRNKGPMAIPATLGLNKRLYQIPQKLLGLDPTKCTEFDFAKYGTPDDKSASKDLLEKYGEYVQILRFLFCQVSLHFRDAVITRLEPFYLCRFSNNKAPFFTFLLFNQL